MAAATNAQWRVLILADDQWLTRSYEMTSNTRLVHVMDTWKDACNETGDWVFASADRHKIYQEEFLTLEMVGETSENSCLVCLRIQQFDKPRLTTDLFVYTNDVCRNIQVEPNQRIGEVLRSRLGLSMQFEYNEQPIDVKRTAGEIALNNYGVITEPCRQKNVSVRLSNGETIIFRVPDKSHVLQLITEVSTFEKDEFSLICQGRHLHPEEVLPHLNHVVEVAKSEFNVHIHGRCVSWTTRAEAIGFPEFLSQLSVNGKFDRDQLEAMQFRCAGCERRITKSEKRPQLMQIDCCAGKSLTLIATTFSDIQTQQELASMIQNINNMYRRLEAFKVKKVRTDGSDVQCRNMKDNCLKHDFNYNTSRMCNELQSGIRDLNDKINSLEFEIEGLRDAFRESKEVIQTLKEEKRITVATMQTLEEAKRVSAKRIQMLEQKKRRKTIMILTMEKKRKQSAKRMRMLVVEKSSFAAKIHTLEEEKKRSAITLQALEDKKRRSAKRIRMLLEEKNSSLMTIQTLEEEKEKSAVTIKALEEAMGRLSGRKRILEEENKGSSGMTQTIESDRKISARTLQTLEEENKILARRIQTFKDEKRRSRRTIDILDKNNEMSALRIQTLEDKIKMSILRIQTLEEENNSSAGKIQTLEVEKRRSTEEILTLTLLVQEAGVVEPTVPLKSAAENHGVKLLVLYDRKHYSPAVARTEITERGKYDWPIFHHIKCFISELQAGWMPFEAVRDKLQLLFNINVIRKIMQLRGKEFVQVTSLFDDELKRNLEDREFSHDGRTPTTEEVGRPEWQHIHEGGQVFLCRGGRRTILYIYPS